MDYFCDPLSELLMGVCRHLATDIFLVGEIRALSRFYLSPFGDKLFNCLIFLAKFLSFIMRRDRFGSACFFRSS
jgi:hypothetical protein